MSQKNVKYVRRIYALLDNGTRQFWGLAPPGFVLDFSRRQINPAVIQGRNQVRAWADREGEIWEGGHMGWQPEEVTDAGEKVVAFIRTSGRGKASGVDVEAYVWNVWTFRDGKPAEWTCLRVALDRAGSLNFATERSSDGCSGTSRKPTPSKPRGCPTNRLTPTPEPAGFSEQATRSLTSHPVAGSEAARLPSLPKA
jgi:ketosteroid isomerase-like protein